MRIPTLVALCCALVFGAAYAQKPVKPAAPPPSAQDEFVIRKPGEITFTTGIVIEGRVEKPQVMLILTKERLKLQPIRFERSFINRITEPIVYSTFELARDKGPSDDLIR